MDLLFTKLNNYLNEKSSYVCKLSETDADVISFYSKYTNQIVFERKGYALPYALE